MFLKTKLLLSAVALSVISATAQAQDNILTISAPWELKAENPTRAGYAFVRMNVAETLIAIDKQGNLVPNLATEWTVSDDNLTWQLGIRDNVTFHDGETLTAEAVKKALSAAQTHPGPLKKAPVKSIDVTDGKVLITLSKPHAVLPAVLTHYTTMILSPKAYDTDGKATKVAGTGPFIINNFAPPQRLDVKPFAEYWGKKPQIAGAKYLATSRSETRAIMVESTPSIMAMSLDPASTERFKKNPKFTVESVMLPRVVMIKLNNAHPFLSDVKVRQALSSAIDRAGIAKALMRAPEVNATQLIPPGVAGWHNKNLAPFTQDVAKAKSLLEQAGWKMGKDGYLSKDGKTFEMTLHTYPDRPELPLIANAIQNQFKQIGVKLNVSIGSYTVIPVGHKDGSLEMALISRNYSQIPTPLASIAGDFGTGGGDWGAMNWKNDAVAKALEALVQNNSDAKAEERRQFVTEQIHTELPIIPVSWYKKSVIMSSDVKNVFVDPFESSYRLNDIQIQP